jgi:hypothetical protein
MLLSYNKPVAVSSALADHPETFAADEEVRTYWSAATGNKGEWITMDLQKLSTVNAVQINYAENNTHLLGRSNSMYYQYLLEYSADNKNWNVLADKTSNSTDVPHDYLELTTAVKARYIRLTNYHVPDGTFALAGLRIFGNAGGKLPSAAKELNIERKEDRSIATLKWKNEPTATGYNIRYGIAKDKLYQTYQVLGNNTVTIRSLSAGTSYYFVIDAFNENGVTSGKNIIELK